MFSYGIIKLGDAMFTPLGIKTDYSLLKSLIKIDDLILYAKEHGYNSLGILDNNLCSSHYFYSLAKKNGIKPIIGLDITIDNYSLYLYPQNMNGLTNLFKLLKYQLDNIITFSMLEKYSQDVICVLPYHSKDIFDNMQFFEYRFIAFSNEEELLNARLISKSCIYIKETLCLTTESSKYINYLHMIENNLKLGDTSLIDFSDKVLEKCDYDTRALTDLINIEFKTDKKYIPHFDEDISDSEEYLRTLSQKGLYKRLKGNVSDKYKSRLNYELDVIANMGFTDYFLIVFDYVRYAIKNNIYVGAGRGSAAGSLVAYSLGITWIDPLKYDLLFERFLNPERITMPDIDVDFEDERIDEVIEYVKEKYGVNRVAHIMTYGTMTAKEVLRSVAKLNDIKEELLNPLLKEINSKLSLKDNLTKEVKKLLSANSLLKKVYEESFYLEGIKKHVGTHAAGVVICSETLDNLIPIIKSGKELLTGYTMNELEELGLLKMDFLSIKNLTIMTNVLKDIYKYDQKKIDINQISFDDPMVYEIFASADTTGVFQFESSGLKSFLKRLKPTCFDDLVMAIAIYRPGPMQSIDTYLERKNNHAKTEYIHPSLEPILKSTYGILIYQEQIMEILRFMGSYSYAEADIIRRAISKKKLEVIENERLKFTDNAIKNGYQEDEAKEVFDKIVKFADFGFNKSHSVAYAMIAYQMAYLKAHYREHYYINLLNTNIGGEAKTKEYINEAKMNGIKVLKADINLSALKYKKENGGIRLPLRVIKGVGSGGCEVIINEREKGNYKDFFDFVARIYGQNINKKTIETLVYAGVFSSFNYNRATLIKNIDSALLYADLISNLDSSLVNKPEMDIIEEYPEIDLMQKEMELYGYYVSTHPASKYPNVMKLIDIAKYFDKYIETVILVEKLRVINTKTGKDMAFLSGSDETTLADFVIFPDNVSLIATIKVGDLVKIRGKVERRFDKYQIIINKIQKV